jgi:hypothetical protein
VKIDPIERTNLTLSAGAVAASLALASPLFTWSLAAGALLEAVNFRGLRRAADFLFAGQIGSGSVWSGLYAFRFAWIGIGIGVALYFGADPIGLLIGLSLIMPAAIIEAWRNRPAIDPDAPSLAPDDPEWDRWNPWLAREREEIEESEE